MGYVYETETSRAMVYYDESKRKRSDLRVHIFVALLLFTMCASGGAAVIFAAIRKDIATAAFGGVIFAAGALLAAGYSVCAVKAAEVGKTFAAECEADKDVAERITFGDEEILVESFVRGRKFAEDKFGYGLVAEISENEKYFYIKAAGAVYPIGKGEDAAEFKKFLAERIVVG